MRQAMQKLCSLGVKFAIDDFGTGYASFDYLKRFPFHCLKVDQSFIRNLPGCDDDCAIVESMVAMAKTLHMMVVAEGVETLSQRDFLQRCGCDQLQGFLYSQALPADEFYQMLTHQR